MKTAPGQLGRNRSISRITLLRLPVSLWKKKKPARIVLQEIGFPPEPQVASRTENFDSQGEEKPETKKRFYSLFLIELAILLPSQSRKESDTTAVEMFPKEYGYVILVLVAYCVFDIWMGLQVGKARKKYKVRYPTLYAIESENKDAKLFNCVQRGHQNSLEQMPMFFFLMVLGGIEHPCACAVLGSVYTVTRYFYFTGYSTGNPQNRLPIGKYGVLALLGLAVCDISFATNLLRR